MLRPERPPVSRVRENRTHGLKGVWLQVPPHGGGGVRIYQWTWYL
jgi:hypothetical protein